MSTTIKGIYNDGKIIRQEPPPTVEAAEVLVTFNDKTHVVVPTKKLVFGYGKGTFSYVSPDFNEPLDDLKDYM